MTVATKRFGFFDSVSKTEAVRKLQAQRGNCPQNDEELILNYLQSGTQVVAVAGLAVDHLSGNEEIIGPPHEFSDGVWSWTADVAYYVRRYHLRVPEELVAHMRSNGWIPKQLQDSKSAVSGRWEF